MSEYWEVRFGGFGGQGIIMAGIILAEAAGIYDGHYAVQSQSYGPEARGGVSRSEVIISDVPIDYPKTRKLDILLTLTQEALDVYLEDLKSDGFGLVDGDLVKEIPDDERLVILPMESRIVEKIGSPVVINIVSLSAIQALTGVISFEALRQAVEKRIPERFLEFNLKAIELGQEMAREVSGKK